MTPHHSLTWLHTLTAFLKTQRCQITGTRCNHTDGQHTARFVDPADGQEYEVTVRPVEKRG